MVNMATIQFSICSAVSGCITLKACQHIDLSMDGDSLGGLAISNGLTPFWNGLLIPFGPHWVYDTKITETNQREKLRYQIWMDPIIFFFQCKKEIHHVTMLFSHAKKIHFYVEPFRSGQWTTHSIITINTKIFQQGKWKVIASFSFSIYRVFMYIFVFCATLCVCVWEW